MVGGFRDQITKYSLNPPSLPIIGEIPFPAALMAPTDTNNGNTKSEEELNKDLKLSNGIMNDFIGTSQTMCNEYFEIHTYIL